MCIYIKNEMFKFKMRLKWWIAHLPFGSLKARNKYGLNDFHRTYETIPDSHACFCEKRVCRKQIFSRMKDGDLQRVGNYTWT